LLHHVEHGREKCLHSALGKGSGVRGGELLQKLGLSLGVDQGAAGPLLVLIDTTYEPEPLVEGLEHGPVERADLLAEAVELAHQEQF